MRRISRRAITTGSALLALALGTATLSGCAGSPFADRCGGLSSGDATELITVRGNVGQVRSVDFPTPLVLAGDAQRETVVRGEGQELPEYGVADVSISIYLTQTGEAVRGGSGTAVENVRTFLTAGGRLGSISRSIQCARAGDRIVLVTTGQQSMNDTIESDSAPTTAPSPESGASIAAVYVIDVIGTYLGKANGVNQLPQDGMPTVVTAVDGIPGIIVPAVVPDEVRTATIKAGGGATVSAGDSVLVHFRTWNWRATAGSRPNVSGGSWTSAADGQQSVPVTVIVSPDSVLLEQNGLNLGSAVASILLSAKVGSQLLVVVPSDSGGATVFVVDVLGITEAADDGD